MSDPLAFFAADDSSSDSEEEDATNKKDQPDEASGGVGNSAAKLPSPDSLFKSVGRPSFLKDPNEKYIDWDRFVKNESEPEEPNIHESDDYAAIPPPSTLNNTGTVTSKLTHSIMGSGAVEFSSPPVTYTNTTTTATTERGTDEGAQQPATGSTKRSQDTRPDSPSEAPDVKRSKGEQFRVKEKRKRDIGQTSRGKNYVEEEKRILRQQFGSDEIMS